MSLTDMVILPGADYQDACDAIREKDGSTAEIKSGELGAKIRAITSGEGESGGTDVEDGLVDGSLTEYSNSRVTSVRSYAFYSSKLTSVDFSSAIAINANAFYLCGQLASVSFPVVQTIFASAFLGCTALTTLDFPKLTKIDSDAFNSCTGLTTLILRNESAVCTLVKEYEFAGSPIASGSGYIYVPSALIEDYKAAWVNFAAQFRALEEYTVDATTTGALDESKI